MSSFVSASSHPSLKLKMQSTLEVHECFHSFQLHRTQVKDAVDSGGARVSSFVSASSHSSLKLKMQSTLEVHECLHSFQLHRTHLSS